MHAAIDCIFRRNHIHHCTRGIWLDWQAQGTRVTQNFMHHNTLPNLKDTLQYTEESRKSLFSGLGEDLFVEVSHGPTLIDNNLLLSTRSIKFASQGGAIVHNLIGGSIVSVGIGTDNGVPDLPTPRYTPYHVPHGTAVAGFMTFLHGDVRFYNNAFVGQHVHPLLKEEEASHAGVKNMWDDRCATVGTHVYNGFETFEEWNRSFEGYCGHGSPTTDRYYKHLPVWMHGNAYFNGALVWEKENDAYVDSSHKITLAVTEKEAGSNVWEFTTNLREYLPVVSEEPVSTETLGMAFEPEQLFEAPDGSAIVFDVSYDGERRKGSVKAGPFV